MGVLLHPVGLGDHWHNGLGQLGRHGLPWRLGHNTVFMLDICGGPPDRDGVSELVSELRIKLGVRPCRMEAFQSVDAILHLRARHAGELPGFFNSHREQ
jgi:hypothetical protein